MSRNDSRKDTTEWWVWAGAALILLLVAVIRIRLLNLPLERDEGEYAYIGQLLLQGVAPFKLAYTMKLPGTPAAYALIMAFFGQSSAGIHLGLLLFNAATVYFIYLLAKKLLGIQGALIAAVTYAVMSVSPGVFGLSAHATQFVAFFATAGLFSFLRAAESRRAANFFLSGLLLGLAFMMKQPGLFFSAMGVFLIVWFEIQVLKVPHYVRKPPFNWQRCGSRLAIFLSGVFLPFGLTCLLLAWAGVFGRFWFWVFTCASAYGGRVPGSLGANLLFNYFGGGSGPDVIFWLLAGFAIAMMLFDRRPGDRKVILLTFLAVSIIAVCPGFYFRYHYFVLALPAVALLVGYCVTLLCGGVGKAGYGPNAQTIPAMALFFICAIALASRADVLLKDSPAEASHAMFGTDNPFAESPEIARYIRDHTGKDDKIAVIGSEPQICFYSRRHSATGYIYTYSLMEPTPLADGMQKEMMREIEIAKPAMLVLVKLPLSWLQTEESETNVLDWRDKFCRDFYDYRGVINFSTNAPAEFHWSNDCARYIPEDGQYIGVLQRKPAPQASVR